MPAHIPSGGVGSNQYQSKPGSPSPTTRESTAAVAAAVQHEPVDNPLIDRQWISEVLTEAAARAVAGDCDPAELDVLHNAARVLSAMGSAEQTGVPIEEIGWAFHPDRLEWDELDFLPDDALQWHLAGFTAVEATAWGGRGGREYGRSAAVCRRWRDAGFIQHDATLMYAGYWMDRFDLDEAVAWSNIGIGAEAAIVHRQAGWPVGAAAEAWDATGIPRDERRLVSKLFNDPSVAGQWWEHLRDADWSSGIPPEAQLADWWHQTGLTPDEFPEKLAERAVPSDLDVFINGDMRAWLDRDDR